MKKPTFGGSNGEKNRTRKLQLLIIIVGVLAIIIGLKVTGGTDGDVMFTSLTEDATPQEITSQIIPEYRDMERALACVVEDKVYVLATRGEKPTTGYDIEIDSMKVEEKDGKTTLIVNVLFTDPQAGASLTQETTYPYVVAQTDITKLPDKIEMKIQYKD